MKRSDRSVRALRFGVCGLLLACAGSASALISDNPNTEELFDGLNINLFLGADAFYDRGYTGSRSVIGNVEGGHIWNGHEALEHVSVFLNAPGQGPQSGEVDRHATWVAQAIGGRPFASDQPGSWEETVRQGMAFGAQLWSGSISTQWVDGGGGYVGVFQTSLPAYRAPYESMLLTGVNGRRADVINGSYGVGVPSGVSFDGLYTDYLANQTGVTFAFAAGNLFSANTVVSPGSAWNNITVGALGYDTDASPYNRRSFQSSRGPNEYYDPVTGNTIPFVRAVVDLCAPGENLNLAYYGGVSGGNWTGTPDGTPDTYSTGVSGTSFASPIVAGGAGLLVDVAYDRFAGNDRARDGRVVKAVLMNSAHKTEFWRNGQSVVAGVVQTTQSLDWNVGAGRMDLERAYEQFTAGTADVPGQGGGTVSAIGWDFGMVSQGAPTDYAIAETLAGGSTLAVTLDWFVDAGFNAETGEGLFGSFDNLDLQVWELLAGGGSSLVAQSISIYNNVEHLYFSLPHDGKYMLRVAWAGEMYDFTGDANSELYGLAWRGTAVPAPGAIGLVGVGAALALRRRRR